MAAKLELLSVKDMFGSTCIDVLSEVLAAVSANGASSRDELMIKHQEVANHIEKIFQL